MWLRVYYFFLNFVSAHISKCCKKIVLEIWMYFSEFILFMTLNRMPVFYCQALFGKAMLLSPDVSGVILYRRMSILTKLFPTHCSAINCRLCSLRLQSPFTNILWPLEGKASGNTAHPNNYVYGCALLCFVVTSRYSLILLISSRFISVAHGQAYQGWF